MKNLQILILLCFSIQCLADEVHDIISQSHLAELKGQQEAQALLNTLASRADDTQATSFFFGEEVVAEPTRWLAFSEGTQKGKAPISNASKETPTTEELLIFVSFGMPESSLKALHQQSKQNKARLVFRGLVNNSFKETQQVFMDSGLEGEIDPILFEKYAIQQVPTFVRVTKTGSDRVVGNISVAEALTIMLGEAR